MLVKFLMSCLLSTSRKLERSCSMINVLDMYALIFKFSQRNFLFLLQVFLKLQKESQLYSTTNKVITLKSKFSSQMKKTPWHICYLSILLYMNDSFKYRMLGFTSFTSNSEIACSLWWAKNFIDWNNIKQISLEWKMKLDQWKIVKELDMNFPKELGEQWMQKKAVTYSNSLHFKRSPQSFSFG